MDNFNLLKEIVKLNKKNFKKQILVKQNIFLFVSLAYNILSGNIKIKNKSKLKVYKNFLSKLAALNTTLCEKKRLLKNTPTKTVQNSLSLLLKNI